MVDLLFQHLDVRSLLLGLQDFVAQRFFRLFQPLGQGLLVGDLLSQLRHSLLQVSDKLPVLFLLVQLIWALVHVDLLDVGWLEGRLLKVLELHRQRVLGVKLLNALLTQEPVLSLGLQSLRLLLNLLLELGHQVRVQGIHLSG